MTTITHKISGFVRKGMGFITRLFPGVKRKGSFTRNALVLSGGTAAAQVITLLAVPILARLYSPSDFGVLAIFRSILGILVSVATLRYSVAITVATKDELRHSVIALCILITSVLTVIFALTLILIVKVFHYPEIDEQLHPYLMLLPIGFLLTGLYTTFSSWCVREKKFQLISKTRLSQSIASALLKIGFGCLGIAPLGLLLGDVTQRCLGLWRMMQAYLTHSSALLTAKPWAGMGAAARRFIRFPVFQGGSQLLLSLGMQSPALLIASLYGAPEAGYYGLAFGMIRMPLNLVSRSVSQVYFAEIAGYGKTQPTKIWALSVAMLKKLICLGVVPIVILAVLSPFLFALVFGEEWRPAGIYARYLAVAAVSGFITSPLARCFQVLEKQELTLLINVIRICVVGLIFAACRALNLGVEQAVLFFCLGTVFVQSVVLCTVFGLLHRRIARI